MEQVAALGPAHCGRKRVQPRSSAIREFYEEAPPVLQHPLLTLDDDDARVVADAFAETIRTRRYTCYACAIMPDHVHLCVRTHRDRAEAMIADFQRASAVALLGEGLRPFGHPVWGGAGWKVFLHSPADVARVVKYVERNPVKARRPAQAWPFVVPYGGWSPGLRNSKRPGWDACGFTGFARRETASVPDRGRKSGRRETMRAVPAVD